MKFFYIVDTMKHHFFPKAFLILIVLTVSLHMTGQLLSEH